MQIRIAIADDHPIVIKGLLNVLSDYGDILVTGTYSDGTQLLKGLEKSLPDILLLDIQMPGKTGDQLAPVILKKYPNLKIITLTNFDSALYLTNMMWRGAKGYILKSADEDVLIHAIRTVAAGGEYIEPTMQDKLGEMSAARKRSLSLKSTLTDREKEILRLIVKGHTCPEIAEKLFLSTYTVENYRVIIQTKMNVNNTATLVKKALELGLTD